MTYRFLLNFGVFVFALSALLTVAPKAEAQSQEGNHMACNTDEPMEINPIGVAHIKHGADLGVIHARQLESEALELLLPIESRIKKARLEENHLYLRSDILLIEVESVEIASLVAPFYDLNFRRVKNISYGAEWKYGVTYSTRVEKGRGTSIIFSSPLEEIENEHILDMFSTAYQALTRGRQSEAALICETIELENNGNG